MRTLFPGNFKQGDEAIGQAWQSSLLVVDSNILLSLYRYSDSTRREFLNILKTFQERLWLPHRAADEYLKNRLTVIDVQERSYDETTKTVKSLEQSLRSARQHPFVSPRALKRVASIFGELCAELEKNKQAHTARISNDEIKESIADLFDARVGAPYDEPKLEEIIVEGERRYKDKIPPGYKDASKTADSDALSERVRKYGDLVLWYQVIDKAVSEGKGVILVTDDRKEDWWERFRGKTVGPRPELVKEFVDRTGFPFLMYQADRFLELAQENLNEEVSDESVEEIREVRRRDRIAQRNRLAEEYNEHRRKEIELRLTEAESLKRKIASLQEDRYQLHQHHSVLQERRSALTARREASVRHLSREEIDKETIQSQIHAIAGEGDFLHRELDVVMAREHELQAELVALQSELAERVDRIEMIRHDV